MILDAEKIVGDYLRTAPEVDAQVVGRTPEDTDGAWVRLTQLDARDSGHGLDWTVAYLLQLDIYAGARNRQGDASALARAARERLRGMPQATIAGAVVARVRFVSMPRIPDRDFRPARERFVLTALVSMHPRP